MGDFLLLERKRFAGQIERASQRLRFFKDIQCEQLEFGDFLLLVSSADDPQLWASYCSPDRRVQVALVGRVALEPEEWNLAQVEQGSGDLACRSHETTREGETPSSPDQALCRPWIVKRNTDPFGAPKRGGCTLAFAPRSGSVRAGGWTFKRSEGKYGFDGVSPYLVQTDGQYLFSMLVRCVKFVLSAVVWLWDVFRFSGMRCLGKTPPGRAVILYYHGIPDESAERFTTQMDTLIRKARPLDAGWQGDLLPGTLHAAVTFDDAFVSVLRNALPVLKTRDIPATIFVPSDYVGAHAGWIKNPAIRESRGRIMDRDQLLAALRHPSVQVGSHTRTHPRLDRLGETELAGELVESRRSLENLLGCTVALFSFPHGIYTPKALEIARSAGYTRVFGIQPFCAQHRLNDFLMGRVLVDPDDWPLEFALKLRGAYRWLARANADLRQPAHN